jgi:hypothetical protein
LAIAAAEVGVDATQSKDLLLQKLTKS